MWPRKQCTLRLGRHSCQLWLRQGRQLQWLAKQDLQPAGESNTPYEPMGLAIQHLAQYVPKQARVQVIADSHWLPILLLDTGRSPLTGEQVHALAMHRFTEARGETARSWQFMSNYLAGEPKALAFGCPTQLRQAVAAGFSEHLGPSAFSGLQPTLNWAMQATNAEPGGQAACCTVLHEQDRSLLVFSKAHNLLGFHPSALLSMDPQQLVNEAKLLAWRCGVPARDWTFQVLSFDEQPRAKSSVMTTTPLNWTTLASSESGA